MADDSNSNNELARLRRRQQPDNTAEVDPTRPAQSGDGAQGDSGSAAPSDAMEHLERRVLGAVRQAVTDVMQEGKQPTDLPQIDMDFVATSAPTDSDRKKSARDINPITDNPSTHRPHIPSADQNIPAQTSRGLTIAVACGGLGMVILGAMFVLGGLDGGPFAVATSGTPDRPVAGASRLSELEHLSSSEPLERAAASQDEAADVASGNTPAALESAQREEIQRLRRLARQALAAKAQRAAENAEKPGSEPLIDRPPTVASSQDHDSQAQEAERQRIAAAHAAQEKTLSLIHI